MLDLKLVRSDPGTVRAGLQKKGAEAALDRLLTAEAERRRLLVEVEGLRAQRNAVSEEVGRRKSRGEDAADLIQEMRREGERLKSLEAELSRLEGEIETDLLAVPNLPHASVPVGTEADNQEVRRVGTPRIFDFPAKAHWDLGVSLGILDFERGAKVSGARFTFYRGLGATLERALINFMLDFHRQRGYIEIFPPFLVKEESALATGQLPKLREEMFQTTDGYFLIPTAEVPVTNLHRDEILEEAELPIRYAAYSACFRAEAGAAGRDTRGLIRQHQFNKVEMVKFSRPEESYQALDDLVDEAAGLLEALELPYRVVALATGDLSFASAKTFDLEVWLPSYNDYKEISSCSNFEDFQARRGNIRYRPEGGGKPRFVHTLNGSGLAVGRTVAALLENGQDEDGSVRIPAALVPYLGTDRLNPI